MSKETLCKHRNITEKLAGWVKTRGFYFPGWPCRLRWRMWRWRVNIESVTAGQNGLVNVGLVITMVRIQTVGQDEQEEKQWRCVDPCKSNHYENWKNPGNLSYDGVKASWRENRVVVWIAVLLVGAGMASFVSRNRRKKKCQDMKTWMFCRQPILPK